MEDENPQQQLALEIFNEFKNVGKTITESTVEIGYAKHNFFIDVSDLGLIAKRALNACHFIASKEEPDEKGVYRVDDEYFRFLIKYESNNLSHLKKSLRDAQKSAAEINVIDIDSDESKDEWASFPLLGSTAISGGKVMFTIPSDIIKHIKDPSSYTYLSLRITASFTSTYAATIYEKLLSTLFRGGTDWIEIDEFRAMAGARNVKTLQDFRNFKRYVLTVAIEQINTLSNIFVAYETKSTSGTKKITHIKFKVTHNKEGKLNLQNGYKGQLKDLYLILTDEFGLTPQNLDEIMSDRDKYTDDRIFEAIEFSRARLKGKNDIKYPGLYLMKALRGNLKLSTLEVDRIKKIKVERDSEKPPAPRKKDIEKVALKERTKKFIENLDEISLDQLLDSFALASQKNTQVLALIKTRGLSSKIVEESFHLYLQDNNLVK